MRHLASIQLISDIQPIKGADKIELAHVLGWKAVVSKNDNFKIGDKIIFCELDSVLPERPEFEFLKKTGFRVKSCKMRGQISQGVCLPLSLVQKFKLNWKIGEDVTEILDIKKFERENYALQGDIENTFPPFIPKTEETRLQGCVGVLDELADVPLYITVKMDGSSATFYHKDGHFGICGRNVEFKKETSNIFTRIAKNLNLEEKLKGLNLAIQGEVCGPKIQGNPLKLKDVQFFAFNVFNIESQTFYSFKEFKEICTRLEIPMVPLVRENFVTSKDFLLCYWLELAKGKYESGNEQEGIVVRSMQEKYSPSMRGRLSFKVISNDFLLKNGE